MMSNRLLVSLLALGATTVACHRTVPPAPAPAPAVDNSAANARDAAARASAARRDSIARAEAAARDAAARADAARRADAAIASARSAMTAAVYFDFDRTEMRADAMAALDAKVPILKANPAIRIRIEGNADDRGSDEYNLALAQRRAAEARRYLVARGIAESRIDVVSFGEERPACREDSESCWQKNRRDEFLITTGSVATASASNGQP